MRKQALLSVSDKTGVVEFARELAALGYHLLSTGGTAKLIAQAGIPVQEVADYTGFPEMLDGRVKTLNPKIHAGILARRPDPAHMKALADHNIDPIDIIVVNLYPFEATVAKPDCTFEDAIENIDIGGPTMIRAAAKNHESVAVVVDPADYASVLTELKEKGEVTAPTRLRLAKKVFCHTARYDAMISNYLTSLTEDGQKQEFPESFTRQFVKVQDMRYGENPHQKAAFYREVHVGKGLLASYKQLHGKALSYNNIADSDAAWEAVRQFAEPACVIIKHANPCGVAVGADSAEAYAKAFKTDSKSAFGGILAFSSLLRVVHGRGSQYARLFRSLVQLYIEIDFRFVINILEALHGIAFDLQRTFAAVKDKMCRFVLLKLEAVNGALVRRGEIDVYLCLVEIDLITVRGYLFQIIAQRSHGPERFRIALEWREVERRAFAVIRYDDGQSVQPVARKIGPLGIDTHQTVG